MAKIKINEDIYIGDSDLQIKNLLNTKALPPGDTNSASYWYRVKQGFYHCWKDANVLNCPFEFGFYIVIRNSTEMVVFGIHLSAKSGLWSCSVNWNNYMNWTWQNLFQYGNMLSFKGTLSANNNLNWDNLYSIYGKGIWANVVSYSSSTNLPLGAPVGAYSWGLLITISAEGTATHFGNVQIYIPDSETDRKIYVRTRNLKWTAYSGTVVNKVS